LGPAFAAVAAGIAALIEVTTASRYPVAGAHLQILLVLAVSITIVFGFNSGMAWAFVGGMLADFLTARPLGTTVFALLIVVALAELTVPFVSRTRYPGCIGVAAVLTPVFLLISIILTTLLRPPPPSLQLGSLIVAAIVNAGAAAVLSPLVIGIKRRAEQRERVVWWR
jgi:rod shape-determining protein MreD